MLLGRSWFAVACVASTILSPSTAAQVTDATRESASRQNEADIIVQARTRKRTGWKRAETDHIIVLSDGSESELIRVTSDLERLHVLMSRLYGTAGQTETSPKLEVTLYDSRDDIKRLGLRNLRSEEGPFAKDFAGQRYYDPRTDGDVIAIARSDQIVHLDTSISHDRFCEGLAQNGVDCIGKKEPYLPSVVRSWQSILYSAFAQHFILTNAPRPYPRWYLDGIGALFSSMEVQGDGSLDYAKPPVGYRQIFYAYGDVNGRDILTGSYLSAPSRRMVWTPYHAWLITHFFVFSDLKPELGAQFRQYMAAIGRGASPEKAALVFRDMTRLSRQIGGYAERGKSFSTAKPLEEASQPSPLVTMLSLAEVAVLDANLKLSDLPPILALSEESIGNAPTQWVDQARNEVIQLPFNAAAMLVIVEAECRNARLRECLTDAERVLAQSPENARALAWKGVALAEQALHSPQGQRANALAVARETIDRALQLDPNDPVAAIAYFQSFTKVGEPVPEPAMVSLAKIATSVPAAPRPRLLLGKELLRQGNTELAQKLLWPVIYGAYDSPESEIAKRLLAISANSN